MAIKFGMTIAEMIAQLTRGFRSVAGRNPDGLEKIKIQQEAVQRFKDMNKVVDMEGKAIDTSKGIMGGKQIQDSPEFGEKVRRIYDEAKGPGKGQEMVDALGSPGARRSYETIEAQLGVRLYGDETFDEILEIQRTGKHPRGEPKKVKETEAEIAARMRRENKEAAERIRRKQKETMDDMKEIEDPEDMAEGGRIGYKDGPDQPGRRKFMKIMGGLAALPIVGKFFKGAKVAAPAAQAVKETVQQAPSYFFDLAAKIKILGKESSTARRERMVEVNYKNYTLEEDLVTGDMTIIKRKGDPDFAYEEEVMSLRKGQADEMTKGKTPPDEYEELTVRPDGEGKMKDVEDGIEPESIQEIVEEVGQGGGNLDQRTLEEIARGKLASGGVAMMLGE
jgi:hypothetical protein